MLLLQQMTVLFILMLIGFICFKIRLLNDYACKKISALVLDVANPAMILYACIGTDSKVEGRALVLTLGLSMAVFATLILLSYFVPLILKVDRSKAGVYRLMTVFSNIGFMGFPIISSVYGPQALLYASLFIVPYNILIYTFGISCMKKPDGEKRKFDPRGVLNVGVISCVVSLCIYLLKIPMPGFVVTVSHELSNLTAPLSMLVIGASLAAIDLKALFVDARLLVFSVLKLLIIPAAGYLIISRFISDELLLGVCFVVLATPVGTMTAMLSQQYCGDNETATKGVALTTLLSVATIPLLSALLM